MGMGTGVGMGMGMGLRALCLGELQKCQGRAGQPGAGCRTRCPGCAEDGLQRGCEL